MEYKTYNNLKIPQNLSPEQQAVVDEIAKNYIARDKEINRDNALNMARIGLGSVLSGASAHPILNIPYVGTGLGGAMYDAGQAIVEGDKLGDIAKRTGRGFAIGETVGAIPYVGKLAGKTKAGQAVGDAAQKALNAVAENPEILRNVRKLNNVLQTDIKDLKVNPFKTESEVLYDSANPLHRYQADLINKYNPAPDSYHTWVRNADDIYKFEDTLKPPQFDPDFIGNDFDPSYTWDMAQDAIKNGEMEVFSSYPIEKGVFVTPSPMEAEAYAGSNQIYSKRVPLDDVAWIDERQGQYAPIDKEYMEGVFNDAKNDVKRLSKQDYRNLGKKYYSNEFMPDGVYKDNYGQIDFNNHNRGKDELQVLQNYPELKGNIQDAEYGFTSNHNNELDREYDHLIKADNKDVYDYVIERLDSGKNIYKMTDRLNKKKK